MSANTPTLWKTPGPWLGLIMGVGTPVFVLLYAKAGLVVALIALAAVAIATTVFFRSFKREDMIRAYGSAALMRYNHRLLATVLAYVVGLMVAVSLYDRGGLEPIWAAAVTLLPTLPALAMIVVMGRYLIEETDEYLRHRASLSAIIGLGCVLVLGTIWGFLETFGVVPHVWAWWVVPVWAVGLGIGQAILSARYNTDDEL